MSAREDDLLVGEITLLAEVIEFPPEPDLAARVGAEIRRGARPEPIRRRIFTRPGFAYALAVTVAVVGALLVFSPATRHAVADFLGIGGIRIEQTGESPAPIARDLDLGARVPLEDIDGTAGFKVRVPAGLGRPDEVYLKNDGGPVAVSMVWAAEGDLPRATSTGVGALLTQFPSRVRQDFIKKTTAPGTEVSQVSVDGVIGYWVEGPHTFVVLDAQGRPREDAARLSANTLLWERGGITYRLEGGFDRITAVEIGNSLD
jgi:hypothetical protein